MSINFTGFNNIKIGKKQYEQFGAYCNHNGEILRGKKKYTELKFNTQLTNDQKGNDLDDFLNRTPKKFINEQNPDKLDLRIKRFDIADADIPTNQTMFNVNGKDLILDSDKKLPLMTFLARFTRESAKNLELSENQQKCMKFANQSISNEAMNYIDAK